MSAADLPVIPDLIIHDSSAFASSLDVARVFGKKHEDVLKKLRNILRQEPAAAVSFAGSEYTDPTGRKLPCFEITKDGFALLGMGFTGIKALWRPSRPRRKPTRRPSKPSVSRNGRGSSWPGP